MKKIFLPLLAVVLFSTMFSCKKKNNNPDNSASVMFVNGCAGTLPAIDAKVDDINVSGALNIAFTANSGYRFIKAGTSVNIAYFLTNLGTPVSNTNVNIANGLHYSAFSGGLVTAPSFVFVADDISAPASNKTKIRFVNLSPDGMNVTATAQNNLIDSGVVAMEVSPFVELTAGTYELKAGDPANINSVVSAGAQTLAAGKSYTLMLTGSIAGSGVSALKVTLINNN